MQLKGIYFAVLLASLTACGGGGGVNNIVPGTSLATPSVEQMKTAAQIYLGTTKAYDGFVNTMLMILPHYDGEFKLDDICSGGGTAKLTYNDTDSNQLVTKGDTYQVVFDKCVTELGTFSAGSINSTVETMPLIMPSIPTSADWKVSQNLTFTKFTVTETANSTTLTTTTDGDLSVTADNALTANQYHSKITANNLVIKSTNSTNTLDLTFKLINYDYTYNRNTLLFKLDNDINMLYSVNGKEQSAIYTTDPVLTGSASTINQGLPTAGQLVMNLTDYKPITLIPQADGQNVSVDIADDGLNAVLMTWASLGLATAQ